MCVLRLQTLCRRFLLDPSYPKEAIATTVCCVNGEEEMKCWGGNALLQSVYFDLPFMGKKHNIYWCPEKDHILGDLLLHSLDPSHLLTNLQTAIMQKGALGVKPEDYRVMCEANILQVVTIQDNLDQQNVSVAKEIFSEKVEKCLKDNKMCVAYMIGITHRWCEVWDEWGLLATRRAKRLQDISDVLHKETDFTQFPPVGNNFVGVSIITYEGILQCNTLHCLLYGLSTNGTYNHWVISTLVAENFFGLHSSGIYNNRMSKGSPDP